MNTPEFGEAVEEFLARPAERGSRWLKATPEPEPQRVIRCSRENADQAIARAIALAHARGEFWRVEIAE